MLHSQVRYNRSEHLFPSQEAPRVNNGHCINAEVLKAYHANEARERITNTKVGCALVVTLMPVGSLLDYFVYPDELWPFLGSRLLCSAIAALIWVFLFTEVGRR